MNSKEYCCHLCGSPQTDALLDLGDQSVAHHFLTDPSAPEKQFPLALTVCDRCGLAQIPEPVPAAELYTNYVCLSSWKPQPHIERMADLVDRLTQGNLSSRIVEIGCNDGNFLNVLGRRGYKNLMGVEPAIDAAEAAKQAGFDILHRYFDADAAGTIREQFDRVDVVVVRQVLEHIEDLASFALNVRGLLRVDGHILIEVPNFDLTLSTFDYGSIWEEHVNYFTRENLATLIGLCGAEVVHSEEVLFSGQALIMAGRSCRVAEAGIRLPTGEMRSRIQLFGSEFPSMKDAVHRFLEEYAEGGNIAIYGAGCRASSAINFLEMKPWLALVVDDQPEKQGLFMAGSRLPIVAAEELDTSKAGLCLLAVNAENEARVRRRLDQYIADGGQVFSIHPPSNDLPPFWREFIQSRQPVSRR